MGARKVRDAALSGTGRHSLVSLVSYQAKWEESGDGESIGDGTDSFWASGDETDDSAGL